MRRILESSPERMGRAGGIAYADLLNPRPGSDLNELLRFANRTGGS